MAIAQLVYVSRLAVPMCSKQIAAMAERASRKNAMQEISGMLLAGSGGFIQLLEGDPMRVIRLFDRIAADERHTAVEKLYFEEAPIRTFARWSMGLLNLDAPERPIDFAPIRTLNLVRDRWEASFENVPLAVEMLRRFRQIAA